MNKILNLLTISVFLCSCSPKQSDVIITEQYNNENTKTETLININEENTRPLILIRPEDTLQIYVRADGAPGMYLDEDGELKGFYVDLEKAVMKEMGQKYKLNAYNNVGVTTIKIRDGIAHSALAVPVLDDFKTFVNMSISYETLKYVTVIQESNNDNLPYNREDLIKALYGKKVGVQTRGHIYQALRDYKDIEIIEFPTTTVATEALNRGEVYAVPEVERIMRHYSEINGWNLKIVGEPIIQYSISTGFSKALDPSIVDRYNAALKKLIDSGYVKDLYNSYFGDL